MTDGSYLFKGYGASVRVDAPYDIDLQDLRSQVAPELAVEECREGLSDLHLTRWNGEYHLLHGERRYGPYRNLRNALRGVSNGIHFLIGKRSPLTFLHAGAVEIEGLAVVFPGRSRWGKSTLVSSLVEQGCGYLSDEYAVVSPEGCVFPFSKPIRLRDTVGEVAYDMDHAAASAPGGFRCAAVILTKYEDGATWKPQSLTSGQAAIETLPSALQSRDEPDLVLHAITALVSDASCYRGPRGSGEPTADMLRGLIEIERLSQEARA
jgi:hypothetical protein